MARKNRKQPIGLVLKAFRAEAGLTQEEVASSMGKTRGIVYQIETGRWQPTLAYVRKFAALVDKSVDEILAGAE